MPARQESGQCTDRVGRYVTVTRHHAAALLQTAREAAAAELDQDRLRNGSERDEDLFLREYPRRERWRHALPEDRAEAAELRNRADRAREQHRPHRQRLEVTQQQHTQYKYTVLHSTNTLYYRVLQSTTLYYRVLHSTTEYCSLDHSCYWRHRWKQQQLMTFCLLHHESITKNPNNRKRKNSEVTAADD